MVQHDGADLVVTRDLFESREEFVGMGCLDRVDHRHTAAAAHAVGIVGGAVGSLEDDVEFAQAGIERADPMRAGCDLDGIRRGFHVTTSGVGQGSER